MGVQLKRSGLFPKKLRDHALGLYDPQQHHAQALVYGGHDPGVCCRQVAAVDLWFLGYPDQARQRVEAALTLAQAVAHPMSLAQALYWTAWLQQLRREGRAIQERAEMLLALATTQGFALVVARGTILHGWVLAMQEQTTTGIAQMQRGLAAHQATGAETFRPYFLALLAEGYRQGGQAEAGLRLLEEALMAVHHHAEVFYEAELYRLKGELLQQRAEGGQQVEEVETLFHQALAIARGQQAKSLELRAAMSLSRLWQRQGKRDRARALLAEIYGWFTEGFETLELQEARALLQELGGHG